MRLSLHRPEKSLDYLFLDRQISEQFTIGGVIVYLHKYLGTASPTTGSPDQPIYDVLSPTNIQDLLFLENRDRKYAQDVYQIRGYYNVQNIDFNMSQFGLFIDNDTLFLTVHINDFIKTTDRKPLAGDVFEFPNLRDEFALNDLDISLPRYYVIEDVGRAAEGFSATWYPHLYRLKLKKITNSQQYADILSQPVGEDRDYYSGNYEPNNYYLPGQIVKYEGKLYQVKTDGSVLPDGTNSIPTNTDYWQRYDGDTLENLISTRAAEIEANNAVLAQAELDAPKSGYETRHFYTLVIDPITGKVIITPSDDHPPEDQRPIISWYRGYLVGDGFPPNGWPFGTGIQFPQQPTKNDYFLRTDFLPNRLFRFDGVKWIKMEDSVRMTLNNTDDRQTQKTSFINNSRWTYFEQLGSDFVPATVNSTTILTNITVLDPLYVNIKYANFIMDFDAATMPNLLDSYQDVDGLTKLKINLPIIKDQQVVIPETGLWFVGIYNYREPQRQSLSQALKPKADL